MRKHHGKTTAAVVMVSALALAGCSGGSNTAGAPGAAIIGALVSIVPLIIAFLGLQRFWSSGLGAGSVK